MKLLAKLVLILVINIFNFICFKLYIILKNSYLFFFNLIILLFTLVSYKALLYFLLKKYYHN